MSKHHTRLHAGTLGRGAPLSYSSATAGAALSAAGPGRLECDHVTPLEREPGQDPYDRERTTKHYAGACHIDKTRHARNMRELTAAGSEHGAR